MNSAVFRVLVGAARFERAAPAPHERDLGVTILALSQA